MLDVSNGDTVLMELRVQLVDQVKVFLGSADGLARLLLDGVDFVLNSVDLVLVGGNDSSESSDSSQMSLQLVVVVVNVMSQNVDSSVESVLDNVPVMGSMSPDGISSSVSSNSNSEVVNSDSVSLKSNGVSSVRNSERGNHMFFMSDGLLNSGNLSFIDLNGVQLNSEGMSQTVNDVSVLNNQSSEVVNSLDMNVDGSSVNDDLVSEGVDLASVSVNNSGMSHNLLLLIFAIQLSGLWDRGHSQTRNGQDTNKGN